MGPSQISSSASSPNQQSSSDAAWAIVTAAARAAAQAAESDQSTVFSLAPEGRLRVAAAGSEAVLAWRPDEGWVAMLPVDDPRRAVIDLYLPICSATSARPVTLGHVGQSLDGFIATLAGESHWITGAQNILHMHRLRALCDAVVIGAGTVVADDPQLTTRLVPGPNPLRVVLDPAGRLGPDHRVFTDEVAETLYVCARSLPRAGERHLGRAAIVGVEGVGDGIDPADVMRLLHARGCARVFVEGGGVTVSMFLEANLLDRLHIAIAPLLIGDGRPAIRVSPSIALGDCRRPRYRVFRMGGDVLFDCDLGSSTEGPGAPADEAHTVSRII